MFVLSMVPLLFFHTTAPRSKLLFLTKDTYPETTKNKPLFWYLLLLFFLSYFLSSLLACIILFILYHSVLLSVLCSVYLGICNIKQRKMCQSRDMKGYFKVMITTLLDLKIFLYCWCLKAATYFKDVISHSLKVQ